jgi:hypothetical protein
MTRVAVVAAALLTACQLVAPLRPAGPATWSLPPDQAVGPETVAFTALVTEVDCASGQTSEGRVVGPEITYGPNDVVVTFAVRPLPGDAQACPGNPATPVDVTLSEPLGDRVLIDGGADPPREPPRCDELPFCAP